MSTLQSGLLISFRYTYTDGQEYWYERKSTLLWGSLYQTLSTEKKTRKDFAEKDQVYEQTIYEVDTM